MLNEFIEFVLSGGLVMLPLFLVALVGFYSLTMRTLIIFTSNDSDEMYRYIVNLIAVTAPLLGLLGTVAGMIETFDWIADSNSQDSKGFTAGISKALLTTQLGIIIAVSSMIFNKLIDRFKVSGINDGYQ